MQSQVIHENIVTDVDALIRVSQRYGFAVARGQQDSADKLFGLIRQLQSQLVERINASAGQAYALGVDDAAR